MGEYQPFGDGSYPFVTLALYGFDEQSHASAASPSRINSLNTKRRLLYLKTQFVPRSKHI